MTKAKKLSLDEVKHVAKLANLPLTEKEYKKFLPQLEAILDFVSKLSEIDTKKIQPTSQVTGQVNVFRDDEIDTSRMLSQQEALSNARESHNEFVKVPAIFQ